MDGESLERNSRSNVTHRKNSEMNELIHRSLLDTTLQLKESSRLSEAIVKDISSARSTTSYISNSRSKLRNSINRKGYSMLGKVSVADTS